MQPRSLPRVKHQDIAPFLFCLFVYVLTRVSMALSGMGGMPPGMEGLMSGMGGADGADEDDAADSDDEGDCDCERPFLLVETNTRHNLNFSRITTDSRQIPTLTSPPPAPSLMSFRVFAHPPAQTCPSSSERDDQEQNTNRRIVFEWLNLFRTSEIIAVKASEYFVCCCARLALSCEVPHLASEYFVCCCARLALSCEVPHLALKVAFWCCPL